MMKPANFLFFALLSICSLTVCHALEAPFPTPDKPFAVRDSGVEVMHENGGPVKWMDNDRVIFTSLRKDVPKSYAPQGLRIVIWDTVNNTVTPYAIGKLRCYSDGRIVYLTEPEVIPLGKAVPKQKAGEMGNEQFFDLGANEVAGLLNPYSCNTYSRLGYTTWQEVYKPQSSFNVIRLHEDHGYLDLYTNTKFPDRLGSAFAVQHYPVKYYRPNNPPINLGINRGEIGGGAAFSKYANAYVLDQLISGKGSGSSLFKLPDGQRSSVRLLSPEGEITTLTYPDALYQITGAYEINVSRAGLLIAAVAGGRFNPKSKTTGLFLARGEKVVKLVDDSVYSLDVSPDGCKVVFLQGILNGGWMPIEGHPFTLKMINVCSGIN